VRAALTRNLWQRLPRRLRAGLIRTAGHLAAPRPARTPRPGPVTVVGLLGSASGLGEGARLMAGALERLGRPSNTLDLAPRLARGDLDWLDASRPGPGEGGTAVVHLNAPTLPLGLALVGRRRLEGKRVVGYWAWELPRLPADWAIGHRHVHEVWTPSRFVAEAVGRGARVVPHPVTVPERGSVTRADLGLPGGLLVLVLLDAASGFTRKNPLAAIRAFRAALADREDAHLVIKLSGSWPPGLGAMREAIAPLARVAVIERVLPAQAYAALLAESDILLSLHRSEGFGLPLAQAMRLGRAVVATGWSGNLDYMDEASAALVEHRLVPVEDPQGIYDVPGAMWAEPEVEHAAALLRRLADSPESRAALGGRARATAGRLLGDGAYARLLDLALGQA
jgi:glycosyltransferase involved in cell wall biosynthesis